jgi:hypothetical protein
VSTEALVPDFPRLFYAEGITGATVRGGHTITRASAANIVALGRPARRVGPSMGAGAAASYHFGYVRSHTSIKQLWLAWYYWPDPDPFATLHTISITTTIRDDLGNTVTSASADIPLGFDGTSIGANRVVFYDTPTLGALGYIDLDAIAATLTGSSWTFQFDWTRSGADPTLDRIEGWECPRSQVYDTDTYGALTGPENPGSPVVAGTTTTLGYERIAKTIEGGIACNRTLLSASWRTDTSLAPVTTSATFTAFTRMLEAGTTPWAWRVRPRVVYNPNSATGEPHRVRVLYQVTGGGTSAVRISTGSTGSPYTLTGLTSATWAWSDWQAIDVPTNGTDRIATITFEGKTTAGNFYVASIEIEENQT